MFWKLVENFPENIRDGLQFCKVAGQTPCSNEKLALLLSCRWINFQYIYFSEHLWMAVLLRRDSCGGGYGFGIWRTRTLLQVFLSEFWEIVQSTYFAEYLWKATSEAGTHWSVRHLKTSVNQRNNTVIEWKNTPLKGISLNTINLIPALLW